MNPLEGQIGGVEGPLPVVLHGLRVRQFVGKAATPWPGGQEGRGLEGNHGSGEEAQRARVHLEPLQNVGRVEEPHHGNPV